MKYDFKNKFKPFIAVLTIVMRDGSGYPVSSLDSNAFDWDVIMKEYYEEKNISKSRLYATEAWQRLCVYVDKESEKEQSTIKVADGGRTFPPFDDLGAYAYEVMEETLLLQAKQMIDDDYIDYFDFSKWGTIYSKAEFKKAYVSRTDSE